MEKNHSFKQFLDSLPGQKEVGLVIAENETELKNLVGMLKEEDFETSENVFDLFHIGKIYIVLEEQINKDFLDFLTQYPTGQVEIFDKVNSRPEIFNPDYKNQSVVLVVSEKDLGRLKEQNFDIIGMVGPVYR